MPKLVNRSPDESADYGLRTRGNPSSSRIGGVTSSKTKGAYFKSWSVPKMPDVHITGMKALGKTAIKADLREIRTTLQGGMIEDDVEGFYTEEEHHLRTVKSKTRSVPGKPKPYPKNARDAETSSGRTIGSGFDGTSASAGYLASNNFYFPFKKMNQWEELKDYLDFVSEQAFNSARHAYVERMEALRMKQETHKEALQVIHKMCADKAKRLSHTKAITSSTNSLVQQLLGALNYHEQRAANLLAENKLLRAQLAVSGQARSKSTGKTSNKRPRSSPRTAKAMEVDSEHDDVDEEGEIKGKGGQEVQRNGKHSPLDDEDDDDDEWLSTVGELVADLRCVRTRYGDGVIHGLRTSTNQIVVKLSWGAVAFLSLKDLDHASRDTILENPGPIRDAILSTFDDHPVGTEHRADDEVSPSVSRPVLFTRPDSGPPRGVPLSISVVSADSHFALPAAQNLDPESLREVYNVNNLLVPSAWKQDEMEPFTFKEESRADLDLRFKRREDLLSKIPFSWGGPKTTPWAESGKGIPKEDLRAWGVERDRYQVAKGDLIRMNNSLKKAKGQNKAYEKRLIELQRTEEDLVGRLVAARAEAVGWRHKVAQILHGKDGDLSEEGSETTSRKRPRGNSVVTAESDDGQTNSSPNASSGQQGESSMEVGRRTRLGPRRRSREASSPSATRARRTAT